MSYTNHQMDVRRHTFGEGKPEVMTCLANDYGFAVNSFVLLGKEKALLIDTQWNRANAHKVVAEIINSGRELETIVLSHAHPDHYFGTEVFLQAFPDAKVYAMPEDIETIRKEINGKRDYWIDQPGMGKWNVPQASDLPMVPLEQDSLYLEGTEVRIYQHVWGDLKYNTMAWVPEIKTLYGSDILFSQAHPFTCEVSARGRDKWIKDLDRFQAYDADLVVPGHSKWGEPYDGRAFDFTREYLLATEEELANTTTVGEFYYNMVERFPHAVLLRSDEMNAQVFKGGKEWYFSDEEDED